MNRIPIHNKGKFSQRGEVATVLSLVGLAVLVVGVVAGRSLVNLGTRFFPKATDFSNLTTILIPVEDTYVSSESPSSNFSTRNSFRAEGSPKNIVYLKFDLRALEHSVITSGNLFLRVTNPTDGVLFLRKIGNTTWKEELLTYNNRLTYSETITSFAASRSRETITVDITQSLASAKGSFLSLAIETDNRDGITFYSKEEGDPDKRPKLTIVYTPLPTPTVTPTPPNTPTPTITMTPTLTPTAAPSAAPEPTLTPTLTSTPSATPTVTHTPTPTAVPVAQCEKVLTTNTSDQRIPSVSGSKAVWTDSRNGNPDIYLFDFDTNTEKQITSHSADQQEAKIFGSTVIWVDWRSGNADIYAYDLTTETESVITSNIAEQQQPEIFENHVVWQDYRNGNWDIYAYDLSTGIENRITTNASDQTSPSVSAGVIVWEDRRSGQYEIYLMDLSSGTERKITNDPSDQYTPGISDTRIVWRDDRNGNPDIYVSGIATASAQIRMTQNISSQIAPAIFGEKIVWQDFRNGNWDVYMYDFGRGSEFRITDNGSHQSSPDIADTYLVWEDRRTGNYNIHSYDLNCASMHIFPTLSPTPTITPIPPSPTPTPDPNCLCGKNTTNAKDECHSSCVFDTLTTIGNYANPIQCSLPSSTTSAQMLKNDWCRRVTRTKGDADGDAKIDFVDFDYYRRFVTGDSQTIPDGINPDFNGDGEVGFGDLTIVRQLLSQL